MEDLQMAAPDRNIALEMVRATEAAAMAAGRWMGRGDKNGVDGAAVNAMQRQHGRSGRYRRRGERRGSDAL